MSKQIKSTCNPGFIKCIPWLCSALCLLPKTSLAADASLAAMIADVNVVFFSILGCLLAAAFVALFAVYRRYKSTTNELADVTTELEMTRKRRAETVKKLEQTQQTLEKTTNRFEGMLFNAKVGVFQMDLAGKCTFINTALQGISGLYPKKALKDGILSAIHPDDQQGFSEAWSTYVKSSGEFNHSFRFVLAKNQIVHVNCRADKIVDENRDVESYIGWITNISSYQEEIEQQQTRTARYDHFIEEAIEGFYKLEPDEPISLSSQPEKIAAQIFEKVVLTDCTESFSTLYDSENNDLIGKTISELKGGCGPLSDLESIQAFMETNYRSLALETSRQDTNGARISLLNNVIGIIEDGKLVGIWGSYRNISQQKREVAELRGHSVFLNRILSALPADVHVKDTRCRYLYASEKMAARTGIPQQDWLGKTIHEIMPATPKDHDKSAIETMKSGKISRIDRPFDVRGKTGWVETIQIPLVSEDGLTEGVVALSLDVSERKQQEKQLVHQGKELQTQLRYTHGELIQSRTDHSNAVNALEETGRKLKITETENINLQTSFRKNMAEHRRIEDEFKRNEQTLVARQQQLEEQICTRQEALDAETDKRRKWEELLNIKEEELRVAEAHCLKLQQQYNQESEQRQQAETNLAERRAELEQLRKEYNESTTRHEQTLKNMDAEHETRLNEEQTSRIKAERHLKRTEDLLQKTQEKIKNNDEKHAAELTKVIAERKSAAEKLMTSMEELDALRHDFNLRLTEETKSIKQELAQKQIREKALRKQSQDLEHRISELGKLLQQKNRESSEMVQAREGAEAEKSKIEKKMELLGKKQDNLLEHEAQKHRLELAQIRLESVKLNKKVVELQHEKDRLNANLQKRDTELEKAQHEISRVEAALAQAQASLQQLNGDQTKQIAQQTQTLHTKLEKAENTNADLQGRIEDLQNDKKNAETNLETRTTELKRAAGEYRKIVDAYQDSQAKLKELTQNQTRLIEQKTNTLNAELNQLKNSEQDLLTKEKDLSRRMAEQQKEIDKLNIALKDETHKRRASEALLHELDVSFKTSQQNADDIAIQQTQKLTAQVEDGRRTEERLRLQFQDARARINRREFELENLKRERTEATDKVKELQDKLDAIQQNHREEINCALAEARQLALTNSELVNELNQAVNETLKPVVKTAKTLEQAGNMSESQRKELAYAEQNCRTLIDALNFRSELIKLDKGTLEPEYDTCDLHELMTEIDDRFGHQAEVKKLFLAVSFAQQSPHHVPKRVRTDGLKLRTTLSILLGYAIQRTEKGRVGLHATRQSSNDNLLKVGFELAFTGIEPDDTLLNDIFSPGSTTTDMNHGLSLAKRYIQMLDGSVELEHRSGGVTALMVEFPLRQIGSDATTEAENDKKRVGAA